MESYGSSSNRYLKHVCLFATR